MFELKGAYNTAKVFCTYVEDVAKEQIINLLNQQFVAGSKIRIMPDTHAGAGCVIGTTMTISNKVVPNLVGVDIGCGMETVQLANEHIELQQLDKAIRYHIPSGFSIRKDQHPDMAAINLNKLRAAKYVDLNRAKLSLGTLGGGNHFIELGKDEQERLWLVVHSGSRHLGKQVAEYYQKAAARDLAAKKYQIDKNLAFCEGGLLDDYLFDMALVQEYAEKNRRAIVSQLVKELKLKIADSFTTIHNYIDLNTMILRKGAISAQKGERLLIPFNMRDGSLICVGKGNSDWNCSAPHGAGRLMSRTAAKSQITLTALKEAMHGIYSTTLNKSTVDEAPMAYKPMAEITAQIGATVEIKSAIKPLYNFKAAD